MAKVLTPLGGATLASAINDFDIVLHGTARVLDSQEVKIGLAFRQCDTWNDGASDALTIGLRGFTARRAGYHIQVWYDEAGAPPPAPLPAPPRASPETVSRFVVTYYGKIAADLDLLRGVLDALHAAQWEVGEIHRYTPDALCEKLAGSEVDGSLFATWPSFSACRGGWRHLQVWSHETTPALHEIDEFSDLTVTCYSGPIAIDQDRASEALAKVRPHEWSEGHEASIAIGIPVFVRRDGWRLQVWGIHDASPAVDPLPPPSGATIPGYREDTPVTVRVLGVFTEAQKAAHEQDALNREMERIRAQYEPGAGSAAVQEDQPAEEK